MRKSSEIFRIRTIVPVGLGIAIGMAVGMAALANVPAASHRVPAPSAEMAGAQKSLSAAPGIRLVRQAKAAGVSCFTATGRQQTETVCAD